MYIKEMTLQNTYTFPFSNFTANTVQRFDPTKMVSDLEGTFSVFNPAPHITDIVVDDLAHSVTFIFQDALSSQNESLLQTWINGYKYMYILSVPKSSFISNPSGVFDDNVISIYVNSIIESFNNKFRTVSQDENNIVFTFYDQLTESEMEALTNSVIKVYKYKEDKIVLPVKYDAVVAPVPQIGLTSQGDYHSIREAFEAGAHSVFVKSGVYTETGHIRIPNGGVLIGEVPGTVVVNFAGQPYSIVCDGWQTINPTDPNPLATQTGTIGITHDTNVVTGSNTNFTAFTPGNFITLGDKYYMIVLIVSDTSLVIETKYQGNTLVDADYKVRRIFSGNQVRNMIIFGSAATGLIYRGVRNGNIECVCARNCANGYLFDNDQDLSITSIVAMSSVNNGIVMNESNSLACTILNASNSKNDGITIAGCKSIIVNGIGSENNGGNGLILSGSNGVSLYGSILSNNIVTGLTISNSTCVVVGSAIISSNGTHGVRVSSSSTKITVSNVSMVSNGTAFETSDASDTRFSNIMVDQSVNSGAILGSGTNKIVLDACSFKGSSGSGVAISTGVTKCMLTACMFEGNSVSSVTISDPAGPGIIISSSISDVAFVVNPASIVSGAVVLSANIVM